MPKRCLARSKLCDFFAFKLDDNFAIPFVSGTVMTIMAWRFDVPLSDLGVIHTHDCPDNGGGAAAAAAGSLAAAVAASIAPTPL